LIREVDEPFFNPTLKAVVARRRRYFYDMMFRESPKECSPSPEVGELLARHARLNLQHAFPEKESGTLAYIDRVRFLTTHIPELELPPLDDQAIDAVLVALCRQRTAISQLRSAPWLDHLRGRYDYQQSQFIDRHAPSRMTVPSGNSISIRYAAGKPPIMEVRIQELFGWKETPRLAGGQVALQLHLLGPNRRPQQITDDLANFWDKTYVQVRKELRRRYPKHHWPEDPRTATATRNGLKPRS
jgi:ATP-dependent helicase HrpB